MLPKEVTIVNILKGAFEFVLAFANMLWVSLIRPHPLFWIVVVFALVAIRFVPALRRR